ncbi:MAG: hypothetical protein NZ937_03935 [Armatimonadetes bacterium]|nr:hypothetical protein [Armatimonadota bacterium]
MLSFVVHEWNDGLIANPNGEVHGVIIPVPVSVMEKAGTYRFVLHFYDDYADSYKNHQVKAALEVNAPRQQRRGLVLLIDTAVPTGTGEDEISEADLRQVLAIVENVFDFRLGIPTAWGIWDLIDPLVAIDAYQLTPQQKAWMRDWAQKQGVVPFVVTIGKIEAYWRDYAQSYLLSGSGTVDSPLNRKSLRKITG